MEANKDGCINIFTWLDAYVYNGRGGGEDYAFHTHKKVAAADEDIRESGKKYEIHSVGIETAATWEDWSIMI